MKCKKCGQEVDKKAVVCTGCGCKIVKPIYKRWWFWGLIVVVFFVVVASSGNDNSEDATNNPSSSLVQTEEITYELVDLQTMFDDLSGNALKAKETYSKKNIQFSCQIANFDSRGSYISVEPVGASDWNFDTAMCYIKNDTQKQFLLQKQVGDVITIKGKVKSVGEVLGYSINISEVY